MSPRGGDEPELDGGSCRLRPWRAGDLDDLVAAADDERVSRGLRDHFPWPYTRADGAAWLADCAGPRDDWRFAIEHEGRAIGGLGFRPGRDIHRHTAEVGYWLGVAYWGRGLAAAALRTALPRAAEHFRLLRIAAGVFADNPASMRVLEKTGFAREGVLRAAVVKRGVVLDLYLYARARRTFDAPI